QQAANEDFTQAININPNDAVADKNRGLAHYKLGDQLAVIEDYTQAININPNDANTYYNRGLARSALGHKLAAIEDFRKAADLYKQQGKESNYQAA
ncbi:MAG: tetratricopeptide repeat protein, partial [Nostoc sp.]